MTDTPNPRRPVTIVIAVFLALIVLAVLAIIPHILRERSLKQDANSNAGPPYVTVVRLAQGSPNGQLTVPGSVQDFDQTPIYARSNGYVKARYADIGDHVRRGQLLALIEDPTTEQALRQAQAALAQQKAALAQAQANQQLASVTNSRWQQLVKAGVVSQQDADTQSANFNAQSAAVVAAKANIAAAEAQVRNLQDQLAFARVTAPFDGRILSRSIDTGTLITSGSATSNYQMFTIGQPSRVRVFASVPQAQAADVLSGQHAVVSIRELPGSAFTGSIARTSQAIDPGTRTLLVEVDLENPGSKILPGMYATVQFSVKSAAPPVILPSNALILRSSGPQAAVVDSNNVIHLRALTLGRDTGTTVEVLSGLAAGDTVVTSAGDRVVDGAQVIPQPAPQS
jgi:RND family efflux transporter MFP subunit